MNDITEPISPIHPDPESMGETIDIEETAAEKMLDAMTPAYEVEFTPEEAELAGAFQEDALSPSDAMESADDDPHVQDAASSAVP